MKPTHAAGDRAAPAGTLADWRQPGVSRRSFHRVREIVPSAVIAAPETALHLPDRWRDLSRLAVADAAGTSTALSRFLAASETSAMVVLKDGALAWEWHGAGYDGQAPHIVFSISKSITGLVTGCLAEQGLLSPETGIAEVLPEIAGSAYGDATVRDLLDMVVSLSFDESYLNVGGDYERYRIATNWNPGPADATTLHPFLASLRRGDREHGAAMHYASPNSDLLGWVCERAAGVRFAELASRLVWSPIGAEAPAEITLDRLGAARSAGGVSVRPRDLARLGEAVRRRGVVAGRQVLPGAWIDDMWEGGDRAAWVAGDMRDLFPAGRYRYQWYETGTGALAAVGIHGQWLWISPETDVVIAKLSHQAEPTDDALDQATIAACMAIAEALA